MTGAAVLVLRCPCPDAASAARIADAALVAHLAAAATTTEVRSRYRWQDMLHDHPETVLTLTTMQACRAALCDLIAQEHPYDLPAITWVEAGATAATADWAHAACAPEIGPDHAFTLANRAIPHPRTGPGQVSLTWARRLRLSGCCQHDRRPDTMLTDLALPFNAPFGLALPTVLGVTGFVVYAGADIALCLRRISSEGIAFYLLNIAAATLIGVSLLYSFNLGAFLTELFCLGTSVLAVALRLRDRRGALTASSIAALRPPCTRTLQGARPMPGPVRGPRGRNLFPDRMA
jgi:periplasmic divalent cation tolerance protein